MEWRYEDGNGVTVYRPKWGCVVGPPATGPSSPFLSSTFNRFPITLYPFITDTAF